MALLAVQDGAAGLAPTFAAATGGGDTIAAGGGSAGGWRARPVVLVVKNLDASTKTVTVTGKTPVVVPATNGIGFIPIDGNGDVIAIAYSAVTSLTVAAVSS